MDNKLSIIVEESGLEETKANFLLTNFQNYFEIADEWEKKAKTIVVTDENQKAEMEMARVGRLFLREKRISLEKSRKQLKEQSLREGKAIDGIANILKSVLEPIEEYLDKQEHFIEIREREKAELARIEEEKRLEKEILEKERIEAEEREKIRLENIRLKEEAEKSEKERLAREKEIEAERAKAEAERKAIEEKSRKEREELELKAKQEREKAENEKRLSEQKAEAERKAMLEKQKQLQEELDKMIECPNCHHKFIK